METQLKNINILFASISTLALVFVPYLFTPFKELFYGYEKIFKGILIVFSISTIIAFQLYLLPQTNFFQSRLFFFIFITGILSIIPVFFLSVFELSCLKKSYKIGLSLLFYLYFSITFLILILYFSYKSLPGTDEISGEISKECGGNDSSRIGIYRPNYTTGRMESVIRSQSLKQSNYTFFISPSEINNGDIIATYIPKDGLQIHRLKDAICITIIEKNEKDGKNYYSYAYRMEK
ncbi:MAG: hypothetical protein JSS37_08860 [Proteobacteria bacterium]|nr:hypothetical protein [Pseudomonadota bacterium]